MVKMMAHKRRKWSVTYTLAGILFGIAFPLGSTILAIDYHQGFSLQEFISIHKENPLLWVIDSMPLFLAFFAFQAGKYQQEIEAQKENLEKLVEERSSEIIQQKLFYEALIQNSPIAVVTLDREHKIVSVNPAFTEMFGYRQEEIMGKELDALVANPERPQEAVEITREVLKGKGMHEFGKRMRKNGTLIDVEIFGKPIMVNKNLIGVLGLYRDITVEKMAREELSASEERFRRMFSDSPVALRMEDFSPVKNWLESKQHEEVDDIRRFLSEHPEAFREICALPRIIDLNDATLLMFHAKNKEELQEHLHSIFSTESEGVVIDVICALMNGETMLEKELVYKRLDGQKIYTITKLSIVPGYEKSWERILFSNMDITERKLAEERLTYISLHDMMTGIYNRAYFEEEMARLGKSRLHPISILVTDMDNLKARNDQYGHQAGDLALQHMADIVKTSFRCEDVVARIGGDEIAVLLPGVDRTGAERAKNRIHERVRAYNEKFPQDIPLSLSIGCATAEKGEMLDAVFKQADEQMYLEKQTKKEKKKSVD